MKSQWVVLLLTYLLTFSIEQSPSWEANKFSASQIISRITGFAIARQLSLS